MKILIVEDEAPAARRLERLVRAELGERVESVKLQAGLTASEYYLLDHPIDLLFLDLDLGGEDGFELLKLAVAGSFQTIVVSANTDRALEAFEYGVLDFVPKPVEPTRLARALERLTGKRPEADTRYLAVRENETVTLVPREDVIYFRGSDNYVEIHTGPGDRYLHRKTLDSLEQVLPDRFRRAHRSYIVDTAQIQEIVSSPGSRYDLLLKNGDSIPLSRSRYPDWKTGNFN